MNFMFLSYTGNFNMCLFQEHSLSETSGFTENNSESDFKTLHTLKSFLGIISDVRKPNEECGLKRSFG